MDFFSVILVMLALELSEKYSKNSKFIISKIVSCNPWYQTPLLLLSSPLLYLGSYRASIILVGSTIGVGVILEFYGIDAASYLRSLNLDLLGLFNLELRPHGIFFKVIVFTSLLNLLRHTSLHSLLNSQRVPGLGSRECG